MIDRLIVRAIQGSWEIHVDQDHKESMPDYRRDDPIFTHAIDCAINGPLQAMVLLMATMLDGLGTDDDAKNKIKALLITALGGIRGDIIEVIKAPKEDDPHER